MMVGDIMIKLPYASPTWNSTDLGLDSVHPPLPPIAQSKFELEDSAPSTSARCRLSPTFTEVPDLITFEAEESQSVEEPEPQQLIDLEAEEEIRDDGDAMPPFWSKPETSSTLHNFQALQPFVIHNPNIPMPPTAFKSSSVIDELLSYVPPQSL